MTKLPLPPGVDPQMILYDVSMENGKYRLIYHMDAKPPQAFRHGEPWPAFEKDMLGSKVIMALVTEIVELREEVTNLQNEIEANRPNQGN